MFKDTNRELARLEAELLQEQESVALEEAPPQQEVPPEYFYTDTYPEGNPTVYQNYSNGYRPYDFDEEAEEDYDEAPERAASGSTTALTVIACVLSLAVTAILLLWLLLDRGVLG